MTINTLRLQVRLSRWAGRELAVVGRSLARHRTAGGATGALAALALAPMRAMAQSGTECKEESTESATSGLVGIIESAATFLIVLGGALALLMLAIGGFLILGGGAAGKQGKYVSKGMDTIKYALGGVAILVSGVFIRSIVVRFVSGAADEGISECADNLAGE